MWWFVIAALGNQYSHYIPVKMGLHDSSLRSSSRSFCSTLGTFPAIYYLSMWYLWRQQILCMHSLASTENRGYNFTLLGRRNCLEILESFIRKAGDYCFSPLLPYSPTSQPSTWQEIQPLGEAHALGRKEE